MIKVKVELLETSQGIERNALNTYTKGPLYCVLKDDGTVEKFPLVHIFRITEEYGA